MNHTATAVLIRTTSTVRTTYSTTPGTVSTIKLQRQLQQQKGYTNNCWNNKDFTIVPKTTDATIETHATTIVQKTTDATIEARTTTTVPKTTDVTRKVTTKHMSQ